jgi:hypothetical protein
MLLALAQACTSTTASAPDAGASSMDGGSVDGSNQSPGSDGGGRFETGSFDGGDATSDALHVEASDAAEELVGSSDGPSASDTSVAADANDAGQDAPLLLDAEAGGAADSSSTDAGPADAGSDGTAPTDAGACNSLTLTAPAVTIVAGTGTVPAGTGGTPVSGTYFLTAYVVYPVDGSPSILVGSSIREQFVLTASAPTEAVILAPGSANPLSSAWTTALSGVNFTSTVTCPNPGVVQAGEYTYDSTAKTLTLYYDDQGVTYTLQ